MNAAPRIFVAVQQNMGLQTITRVVGPFWARAAAEGCMTPEFWFWLKSLIPRRQFLHCPLWVEIIYRAAGALGDAVEAPGKWLGEKLQFRWGFMDSHCWCERCEERRGKGAQGPRKGSLCG